MVVSNLLVQRVRSVDSHDELGVLICLRESNSVCLAEMVVHVECVRSKNDRNLHTVSTPIKRSDKFRLGGHGRTDAAGSSRGFGA